MMGDRNPFNLTETQRDRLWEAAQISPDFAIGVAVCLWNEPLFEAEYPMPAAIKAMVRSIAASLRESQP